jgi:RNA polymerase sigma-70 factor, ECF subfamily
LRSQRAAHWSAALLTLDAARPGAFESVEALVRASQAGSRDAFGALYERFAGYVHAILIVRLPPQDTPDLVQDIFLSAFERLRSLREPAAFAGWIATIARNRATDYLRQRPMTPMTNDTRPSLESGRSDGRDRSPDVRQDPPAHVTAPEDRLDAARALEAIRRLPDAYRETLVLRLVEGLTGPEIAALTGLTPDSVRVNLHRGFKLLRERLGVSS